METEINGNCANNKKCSMAASSSMEDLSEYTDADESISAPTEILAEFLSAVMLKDYETALKYCKIILQYEPNHATAREFYPLILEKLIQEAKKNEINDEDANPENESNEEEEEVEEECSDESESSEGSESAEDDEKPLTDSDGTTASYSSLEDEEADAVSPQIVNTNNAFLQLHQKNQNLQNDNEFNKVNGNKEFNSDSESPTEPVSQMLITEKLRSLVVSNK